MIYQVWEVYFTNWVLICSIARGIVYHSLKDSTKCILSVQWVIISIINTLDLRKLKYKYIPLKIR